MVTAARATGNIDAYFELVRQIEAARAETDRLFALVDPGALYDRPIPERHRIVFYRGHLEAFDWNLLQSRLAGVKTFDAGLDRLFAFGIDPVDGELPSDQPSDWPALPQVESYASRVRTLLDAALANAASGVDHGDQQESLVTLLNVALEHRLMHAETLAYMLHQLPLACKRPESEAEVASALPPAPGMVRLPAGDATLGLSGGGSSFGWDNEFDQCTVHVAGFEIDRFKVTNAEYLEFVRAGGYQARDLWTEDGWKWIRREQISHPVFWTPEAREWRYRGMFQDRPLPLDWPVYVSHAEAAAYARWCDKRLPSEAEWHRAAYATDGGEERPFPWGSQQPAPQYGSFDLRRWDPWPVNAVPRSASAFGAEGLVGNGWEWTSTPFGPLPGFTPFPFYKGYSADFFDGKHFVMKGGSARTDVSMLRRSFRNWFQPHYPYVYATFRCVEE